MIATKAIADCAHRPGQGSQCEGCASVSQKARALADSQLRLSRLGFQYKPKPVKDVRKAAQELADRMGAKLEVRR